MGTMWIAVIYAVLRHPIEFLRSLRSTFQIWGSEPRSNRIKNGNRDALAEHFGMTREELDELMEGMRNER